MNTSSASFDTLAIADGLGTAVGNVTSMEIHIFSYLACLLTLYDDRDPAWWGYSFSATQAGAPYSEALKEAYSLLVAGGLLIRDENVLRVTSRGLDELMLLSTFDSYAPRLQYLSAACSSALALPLASIGETLLQEPQLRSAIILTQTRPLLDEAGIALLEPYINALREVLHKTETQRENQDLLVPAIAWLKYLAHESTQGTEYGR